MKPGKIEKLTAYLQRLGVQQSTRRARYDEEEPAVFYLETYGNRGYFENAPGLVYPAAVIMLDYNTNAGPDYFRRLAILEKMIYKYAARNGLEIFNTFSHPWTRGFSIAAAEDREAARTYYSFVEPCVAECEQAAHKLYTAGKPEEVEATLRAIMNTYGASYNELLRETRTA